jgi:hypothetical protein
MSICGKNNNKLFEYIKCNNESNNLISHTEIKNQSSEEKIFNGFNTGKHYKLNEYDKYALLKSLKEEFNVEWIYKPISKEDIPRKTFNIVEKINTNNLSLIIQELNDLLENTTGKGKIIFKISVPENSDVKILKNQNRTYITHWNYLWEGRYPLLNFSDICIHELKLPFKNSQTEYLAKRIHMKYI